MSRRDETPRDLLFGLLALQVGLIDQEQLIAAFGAWSRAKGRTLAEILIERGSIDQESRSLLAGMAEKQLKLHGGDAEKSIAAIAAGPATREKLVTLVDADLPEMVSLEPLPTLSEDAAETMSFVATPTNGQRFRVLRPHAQGGLGAVFVALDGELNREVALKQILDKLADDPTSRTRFLIEAEITGGLEHPGIVPVYGLGRHSNGRPYYAMRFIRGDSLKEAIASFHSDDSLKRDAGKRSLALRKLLRRFVDVCNAIDYAHGRGVLHRDLKPSNVIVGKYGETLVVDWGLAKPMGHSEIGIQPDERTLMPSSSSGSAETLPGSAIGTPAYMSPEQSAGDLQHLSPRSDVYSLGATLYCLLTGKAPFEGSDLGKVLHDVQMAAFPSPRRLDPSIDRALEAVCLKAMATKPGDRHATARALADDLERWSADEPVSAWSEPWTRTFLRWLSRHRTGVTAASAAILVGVVGLSFSTILLRQSRDRVDHERKRAQAVNEFLVKDLLAQADPKFNTAASNMTVRELLDKAAKALDASTSIKQNPEIEGTIRSAIGNTYYGLGLYPDAMTQLERAVGCQKSAKDFPVAERIFTMNLLNWVNYKQSEASKTIASSRATFAEAEEKLGVVHEQTIYAADNLATMLVPSEEGFSIFRNIIASLNLVHGPDHLLTLQAQRSYASALTLYEAGDDPKNLAEGLALYQTIRDKIQSVRGPDHPENLYVENGLGFALARSGKFAEAREVLVTARERSRTVFGSDHLQFAQTTLRLSVAEDGLGHTEAAEKLVLEAAGIRRRHLSPGHSQTLETLAHLARISLALGKTRESARYCAEIIQHSKWYQQKASTNRDQPDPQSASSMDALEGVFAGHVDPASSEELLGFLRNQLQWLDWKSDWFRSHVECLWGESVYGTSSTASMPSWERDYRNSMIGIAFKELESNPSTPLRIVEEDRARLAKTRKITPQTTSRPK